MMIILLGIVTGMIGGMGIGGGTILIPALTFFLSVTQHTAQTINLLIFLPTACISLLIHRKNKLIAYKTAFSVIPSGILGAVLGAKLALFLHTDVLRRLFGIFLILMGCLEFRKSKQSKNN